MRKCYPFRIYTKEICSSIIPVGTSQKKGHTESKEAVVKAVVAEGKLVHQNQFESSQIDPLLMAFIELSKTAKDNKAVLVLDNLESIIRNDILMSELASIILLLDDNRYATCKIKLLIVGVPNAILDYFTKTPNMESVSNRIEEIQKVSSLTLPMVQTIVREGFVQQLRYSIEPSILTPIAKHIYHITMGVAQRVHEYCEKLAYLIEDSKDGYSVDMLKKADYKWLHAGLRQAYTVVESHLNSKRTEIARKNQVIYCIGKIKAHQLDTAKIIEQMKIEFIETVSLSNMGISAILNDLANGASPLLSKNPKTNEFRVIDPRYTMCIRTMLRLGENSRVEKLSFAQ